MIMVNRSERNHIAHFVICFLGDSGFGGGTQNQVRLDLATLQHFEGADAVDGA